MPGQDDSGDGDRDHVSASAPAETDATGEKADKRDTAGQSEAAKKPEAGKSLLPTVNAAAQRVQALWISFISFGAYLTITVLGTTHLKLFLAEPVKLPVFAIDLPLTNFYFVAPTFFLIFHFYFLTLLLVSPLSPTSTTSSLSPLGQYLSVVLQLFCF